MATMAEQVGKIEADVPGVWGMDSPNRGCEKAFSHQPEHRPGSTPPRSDAPVMELLRDQAALYARLESHARRQRHLVCGDDAAPLLAVLADRQRLALELAQIGTSLAPIRRDWESYRGGLNEQERGEADRLVAETAACLQRVIESDEHDARLLSARRTLTARDLQTTRAGGSAISAYRPTTEAGTARHGRFDEAT